jgi:hypothetical protein
LPVDAWHEVIGDPTFADAILVSTAERNQASVAE